MDAMFWTQLAVVMVCVAVGGRLGGVGLGAAGGLGVCLLVLGLGCYPGEPPVSVLLIIIAVISCTSILQGAGGLDLLVSWAEKLLRACPRAIVITGPLVCGLFVILVGTAYVAFAIYPVIAEVAASVKVRPERAVSASVISAGIGVMASPMSAAMAAMVGIMAVHDITLLEVISVTLPTYIIATLAASLSVYWRGSPLEDDPEFKRRVASGEYTELNTYAENKNFVPKPMAKRAVAIFLTGIAVSMTIASVPGLRPAFLVHGIEKILPVPSLIQMVILATACFIILCCKVPPYKFASGSVFRAGLIGVVGVFGIAWCTSTFFDANTEIITGFFSDVATRYPFLFCLAAFGMSTIIFSPTVTTTIMVPLGLKFGFSPEFLIGTWACCMGDFVIPGGAQIGCTAFDRTGTTRLGSWVVNHSYIRPGLVFVLTGTLAGWLIAKAVF